MEYMYHNRTMAADHFSRSIQALPHANFTISVLHKTNESILTYTKYNYCSINTNLQNPTVFLPNSGISTKISLPITIPLLSPGKPLE